MTSHVAPSRRVAGDQRQSGQDAERCQPVPPAAGIMSSLDMDALQDGTKRNALRERRQQRSAGEREIPAVALALRRPPAKFKGDAAEDQADQHRNHRRVERRHQHGIGERKRRHHSAAAEHEPGFVAVPDRRDAVHDDVAIGLRRKQREQQSEAEIEAVHHHIDKDRERDDERPDGCDVDHGGHPTDPSAATPAAGVIPAARAGISPRGPCSP